jgi:hypothetical protein
MRSLHWRVLGFGDIEISVTRHAEEYHVASGTCATRCERILTLGISLDPRNSAVTVKRRRVLRRTCRDSGDKIDTIPGDMRPHTMSRLEAFKGNCLTTVCNFVGARQKYAVDTSLDSLSLGDVLKYAAYY